MVKRPSQKTGSSREALPEVRERSGGPPKVRKWSRFSPRGPGVVRRPPGGLRVIEMPSRRSWSGQEYIPEVRVWSGVVGRPSRRFGSG